MRLPLKAQSGLVVLLLASNIGVFAGYCNLWIDGESLTRIKQLWRFNILTDGGWVLQRITRASSNRLVYPASVKQMPDA
jgi:hypothetical protein